MKTVITRNYNTRTGLELRVIGENGHEVYPLEKTMFEGKTGINWVVLPENPSGRKLFNPGKMEGLDEFDLTTKTPRATGESGKSSKFDDLLQFLTEDERTTVEALLKKAEYRKTVEKARLAAQAAQAEYEKLLKEAQS